MSNKRSRKELRTFYNWVKEILKEVDCFFFKSLILILNLGLTILIHSTERLIWLFLPSADLPLSFSLLLILGKKTRIKF